MTDPTLRFENLTAARLSSPLRTQIRSILRAVTALWVVLAGSTDNPMPTALVPRFQTELARLLGRLDIQTSTALEAAVVAGLAMGAGHARRVTGPVATQPTPSAGLLALIREVDRAVRAQIRQARRHAEAIPPVRYQQALAPIAVAQQAADQIDRTARTAVNRAINEGSAAVSRETDAQRVWVPERDACLHCLAYAGLVVGAHEPWPGGLTFYRDPAGHLKPIGHDPVDSPPLHPYCRCREQPWLGSRAGVGPVEMPQALQREAQRSVLAGHALGSEPSRLRAADALLSGRGVKLLVNRTVQQRARRAVAAGRFAQRQRRG